MAAQHTRNASTRTRRAGRARRREPLRVVRWLQAGALAAGVGAAALAAGNGVAAADTGDTGRSSTDTHATTSREGAPPKATGQSRRAVQSGPAAVGKATAGRKSAAASATAPRITKLRTVPSGGPAALTRAAAPAAQPMFPAALNEPVTVSSLINDALRWTGRPPLATPNPIPTTPVPAPVGVLWQGLRRIDYRFTNASPTAAPIQYGQDMVTRQVDGALRATDPNGDQIGYTVTTAPVHGTVKVNNDGTYAYKPNSGFAGTDTFAVTIGDDLPANPWHLHGLADLLGLADPPAVTVSVTVADLKSDALGLPVGDSPVGLAVDPSGRQVLVANSGEGTVSVVDTERSREVYRINVGGSPVAVAFTPDGSGAYVVDSAGGTVAVIDTEARRIIGAPIRVGDAPNDIAITNAAAYVVNSNDDTVSVIDTTTSEVVKTVTVGKSPYGVTVNHAGTRAYVTNELEDSVSVIDTATNTVVDTIKVGDGPTGLALSPVFDRLFVTNHGSTRLGNDGTISVIDTVSNTAVGTIGFGDSPVDIVFSPDGSRAYVAGYGTDEVGVIDAYAEAVESAMSLGSRPAGLAVGSDGGVYVTNFLDGTLNFYNGPGLASAPEAVEIVALDGNASTDGAAAATAASLAAASTSTRTAASARPGTITKGFDVVNLTPYPLTLTRVAGSEVQQNPVLLSVLQPGSVDHYEVTFRFFDETRGAAVYRDPLGRTYSANFIVSGGVAVLASKCSASSGTCTPGPDFTKDTTQVVFRPAAGTVTTIPPTDNTRQSDLLNNGFCRQSGVSCSFTPISREQTYANRRAVGPNAGGVTFSNNGSTAAKQTFTDTTTTGTKTSYDLTAKTEFGVDKVWKVALEAKYGQAFETSRKNDYSVSYDIPPYTRATLYAEDPIYRVTGDFTIQLDGKTKIILKDVTIDTPDSSRPVNYERVDEPLPTKP